MGFLIYICVFTLAFMAAVFFFFKWYNRNKTEYSDVVNYDFMMRNYYFLLNGDERTVMEKLSLPSVYDKPRYTFDDTEMTITFTHRNTKNQYRLKFFKSGERAYLNVYRTNPLLAPTIHPYILNSLFVQKINAVPVTFASLGTIMNQTENT